MIQTDSSPLLTPARGFCHPAAFDAVAAFMRGI
jgi:hypothetical protein